MNQKNIITDAFTELAPNYIATMDQELFQFWGIHYQDFVNRMLKLAAVRPGEKVLDLATGNAVIPMILKPGMAPQDQIVGLDITPAMLAEGRKQIARGSAQPVIHLVCASAMAMPFSSGSFEVVMCGLGTHHMDVPQMLQEARRVLMDGGRLVISDVCATPFWRSAVGKVVLWLLLRMYGIANSASRARAEVDAYQNVRTTREWSVILRAHGFDKIKMDVVSPRLPWFPGGLTLTARALA